MGLKINGITITWPTVISVFGGIFWVAGLSFQVAANTNDIDEHIEIPAHTAQLVISAEVQSNIAHLRSELNELNEQLRALNSGSNPR
jgi:hypothetical protein